ncbi:L-fucose isomerase [Sesbania bispinosa]|nr:L-fucose isomerase [Sesbania bispinosa]
MAALSTVTCEEEFNQIIKSMSRSSSQKDKKWEAVRTNMTIMKILVMDSF